MTRDELIRALAERGRHDERPEPPDRLLHRAFPDREALAGHALRPLGPIAAGVIAASTVVVPQLVAPSPDDSWSARAGELGDALVRSLLEGGLLHPDPPTEEPDDA